MLRLLLHQLILISCRGCRGQIFPGQPERHAESGGRTSRSQQNPWSSKALPPMANKALAMSLRQYQLQRHLQSAQRPLLQVDHNQKKLIRQILPLRPPRNKHPLHRMETPLQWRQNTRKRLQSQRCHWSQLYRRVPREIQRRNLSEKLPRTILKHHQSK